jgi:hypothetical protein
MPITRRTRVVVLVASKMGSEKGRVSPHFRGMERIRINCLFCWNKFLTVTRLRDASVEKAEQYQKSRMAVVRSTSGAYIE